jgi:uncharacterized protein YdaU (DUF1376 family)
MKRWYKRCGADFIHGTMGLSLEEKGAYSLCLDLMYDHEGPIPDDARWLAGICGVSIRKWTAIRNRLVEAGKLDVVDGRLINSRALFEIENAAKSHRNAVETGAKGGRKPSEKASTSNENNNLDEATLKGDDNLEKRREEKNIPPNPLEGEFEEFYREYPRRLDPKKAERAYRTARKTVTHAKLMAGVRAYRDEVRGQNPKFIKHPASWLNAGSWENTPAAEPTSQNYSDDMWETFLVGYAEGKPWPKSTRGPAPNEAGCQAPERLLSRYLTRFGNLEPGHLAQKGQAA